jgi:alanine racemase
VSYGALWRAPRATTVATLGIGYADGLRRSIGESGTAPVLVGGERCAIVGAVTMDLAMIDTRDRPVAVGDVVTLIGEANGGRISLEEFSGWSGMLQREVLTSLGPRLPRIYD